MGHLLAWALPNGKQWRDLSPSSIWSPRGLLLPGTHLTHTPTPPSTRWQLHRLSHRWFSVCIIFLGGSTFTWILRTAP